MHKNLTALGAQVEELPDALVIHGTGTLRGGVCDGFDDHRIIMAMAVASLACNESITIHSIDAVAVTFPTFFQLLDSIRR
jgi:3-phosphoshikimate 1-carboxyvinyltransferase